MTDILRFNFCTVHVFDNYLIVEIDEGITIASTHSDLLKNLVDTYFNNRPFVYISKRTYSYNVEPNVYSETQAIENLKGFAVVGKNRGKDLETGLISGFTKKPYNYFETVEEATNWAKKLMS